jgi:acyl-CoA thioesterase FadM
MPTRWMDNDVYGHVNNVVYYSYFDTDQRPVPIPAALREALAILDAGAPE